MWKKWRLKRCKCCKESYNYMKKLFQSLAPESIPMETLPDLLTQIDNWCTGANERARAVVIKSQKTRKDIIVTMNHPQEGLELEFIEAIQSELDNILIGFGFKRSGPTEVGEKTSWSYYQFGKCL